MLILLRHVCKRSIHTLPIAVLLCFLSPLLSAQFLSSTRTIDSKDTPTSTARDYAPPPSDVLTPNTRRNTPYLKIGVRAGVNLSA